MIYDSHCHLDLMSNMIEIIQAICNTQTCLFAVGTTPKAYNKMAELCKSFSNIYVGLGMHPQLISSGYDDMSLFERLLPISHYVGEIGLDYSKNYIGLKDKQIEIFEKIISMCEQYGNKVISIHSLKAINDVLDIIKKNGKNSGNRYILHWYTGTKSQLFKAIELGCYFSINPKMIHTKSGVETIQNIPIERILLETDTPFTKPYASIELIEKDLEETIKQISKILKTDISHVIEENSKEVFVYH